VGAAGRPAPFLWERVQGSADEGTARAAPSSLRRTRNTSKRAWPSGHLAVYCAASPGCRPVWYRPRCEWRS
jgi:hypothetical protein